ncbi:MAG TPA: patatin-like phospholipase family protein [Terriglobia bacterium]|nr:patatin-like phospholipase family protein [Terriglobia bacterium]
MEIQDSINVAQAKNVLRGQGLNAKSSLSLAKRLKEEKEFSYARQILAKARQEELDDPALRLKLAQQQALCTYKDPNLPADERFDEGRRILNEADSLETSVNQETLGLAGAIFKYRWEVFGQMANLERSLTYYTRGYQQGIKNDWGYTAINAAFVLDVLAALETASARSAGGTSESARIRKQQAEEIRRRIIQELNDLLQSTAKAQVEGSWWFWATLAEAHFGLGEYKDALKYLGKRAELKVPEWDFESTARQAAALARWQFGPDKTDEFESSEAWQVLRTLLGDNEAAVRQAFFGKIGLALSGGGFRASLFHIGVLARLAELDVLRSVEVLSCVSGGSIVGAHYYLEVRKLLKSKSDHEVTRQDYIDVVKRIEKDFLAGVQRNIRTRVALSIVANWKMIFSRDYSRTERIGELYEKEIFSRVGDQEEQAPRYLNQLFIQPPDGPPGFAPKTHNWKRSAKVPILVLNATTLNTGHNWQFTASWMGEPPTCISSEVDGNYRLRRMYYQEAPERYRDVRLGLAVAASSCVPGLFEPIVLPELYPEETVRLVDGGVHDNQGIASLLEQDCTVLLVSDASGQMGTIENPSSGPISALLRSNGISMSRVRETEYLDVDARRRSSLLRGVMFIHLKKDLDVIPKNWIGCEDPEDPARQKGWQYPLTTYGIRKDIQAKLACVRTDLDSFCDLEAYALMCSGYMMTQSEFPNSISGFGISGPPVESWDFLKVLAPMQRISGIDKAHHYLMKVLLVAQHSAFKIWRLSPQLKIVSWIIGVLAAVELTLACWHWRSASLVTLGALGVTLAMVSVGWIFGKTIGRVVRYHDTLRQIAIGVVMGILGSLLARLHIHVFDKGFLAWGRMDRLSALGLRERPYSQPPQSTGQAPSCSQEPIQPSEPEKASPASSKKAGVGKD